MAAGVGSPESGRPQTGSALAPACPLGDFSFARVGPRSCSHNSPCPWQKLDLERETIELVHTEPTEVAQLPSRVPRDAARYHFFLYKHTHEGDPLESVGECAWTGAGWPCRRGRGSAGLPASAHVPRPAPTVFIYSMPGYKCSIKERMLYSSCKSRLLDSVEQDFQLEISKKVGAHSPEPHHPGACTTALHLGRWSPKAVVGQGY